MMVLGNIVAVTSIIAVVSLIQGMDGYVADAIVSEVGAGTFRVERVGVVTSEEEEERARGATRASRSPTRARSASSPTTSRRDGARRARGADVSFGDTTLEGVQIRGVSRGLRRVQRLRRRARPAAQPSRGRAQPAGRPPRLGYRRERCSGGRIRSTRSSGSQRRHFRVVGVSEKKGSVFGNSQDEFAVIPLGAFQQIFGSRRSLSASVKPVDPR